MEANRVQGLFVSSLPCRNQEMRKNLALCCEVLRGQAPKVLFVPFSFGSFGPLLEAADELFKQLQGLVRQASVGHEGVI
jgi:hypothetical protein